MNQALCLFSSFPKGAPNFLANLKYTRRYQEHEGGRVTPAPAGVRLAPLLIPGDFYFTSIVGSVGISMGICCTLRYIYDKLSCSSINVFGCCDSFH